MATKPSLRQTRPTGGLDPKVQVIYENLEILGGARGNGMDRAVLVRDLLDLGLATSRKGANGVFVPVNIGTGGSGADEGLVEAPEVPKGVSASGGFSTILIEWNKPTYSGHSYTEVLRADTDDFSQAVKISTTAANLYSDQVGGSKIVYYWVRFVNRLDIKGPVQSTNGVRGETQADIGDLLDQLRGQIDTTFMTPVYNTYIQNVDDLTKLNSQEIKNVDGKVVNFNDRMDILSVSADILEEAALEAATGVDSEGIKRRKAVAEIKLEQKVIVTDIEAQAQQILTITASIGDNLAQIQETKNAIVTLDSETNQSLESLTQVINAQRSDINGNIAAITNQSQTLVQQGSQIDGAILAIGDLDASTDAAIASITTSINAQESKINLNTASITSQGQTLVLVGNKADQNSSSITSLTNTVNTQQSAISGNTANIQTQSQTLVQVSNKANSNATQITAVSETVNSLSATVAGHTSSITTNSQTIVTVTNTANTNTQSITSMSQRLTTVESTAGSLTASVSQNTQTIATINADGSTAYKALWGIKASVGAITAGIGLTISGGKSQCTIIADQFSVGSQGSNAVVYPFIVTANGVFIDTAYIKAAKIQDLVAGDVIADNIKASATLTAPKIKGGTIEIGSRFTVDANGNMEANYGTMSNATVTGTINANAGVFNNVTIEENCNVKGTIYANKIVGDVYKAELVTIAEKGNFGNYFVKNQYITIFSFYIAPQNLTRKIEMPSFIFYGYNYEPKIKYLYNGATIYTGLATIPLAPYFITLPANTAATIVVQATSGEQTSGFNDGSNPFPTQPVPPYLPAQTAKYAVFKS